jgi:hypothetical protein
MRGETAVGVAIFPTSHRVWRTTYTSTMEVVHPSSSRHELS